MHQKEEDFEREVGGAMPSREGMVNNNETDVVR